MKKITIINAYGDKNIGDGIILNVAIRLINKAFSNQCRITALYENVDISSQLNENKKKVKVIQLPYGYAIRGENKASFVVKIIRFTSIYLFSYLKIILNTYFDVPLPNKGFYSYLNEIKKADVIIGIGGGYFITNNKFKDYFGLLLTLLPTYIAKFYNKKILYLPISFGPFASTHHQDLTYKALTGTTVMARDNITLNNIHILDKKKKINAYYVPDLALFYSGESVRLKLKLMSEYIVVTARDLTDNKNIQKNYEESLANVIDYLWMKYKLKTFFVPMARNKVEDNDNQIAHRLLNRINNKQIFTIKHVESIRELQDLLSKAKISICTRMHSAILSSTVNTPFIAIGYGHKTLGFVKTFDIEKWHIDYKDINKKDLISLSDRILQFKNYKEFNEMLRIKNEQIKKIESSIVNKIMALR